MATIELLNYDVLLELFSYLSLYERQRMGLVCKKFQNIYEIMMGSVRKMCYVSVSFPQRRYVEIIGDVLNIKTNNPADLEEPLKKFAGRLKKIQITDDSQEEIPSNIYELLTKCTNLSYAQLKCRWSRSVEQFLKFLPTDNLEDLSIHLHASYESVRPRLHDIIGDVLSKTPNLKSLNLHNVPISELSSIGGTGTLKTLFLNMIDLRRLNFDMTKLQNLETLILSCIRMENDADITELIRNSKKLHSIEFASSDVLSKTILNEMISLPNLRRLHLLTIRNSYESWHKFSNLEDIHVNQVERFLLTRDQIKSFLKRSKNLKTYSFEITQQSRFNELFREVASDIGHKCKKHNFVEWTRWHKAIPF
ncbi:hypothetical protein PV328_005807 [Microctonus aethiopoides]|uniref:F-box domain-containing protein n=1 Tax=Microctonus aethiopoides TaxID=144406 RepID=A0AA39KSW3_9HYME|nr:hypothetical protein PV328_005807 [Microctonus aethiopoides]